MTSCFAQIVVTVSIKNYCLNELKGKGNWKKEKKKKGKWKKKKQSKGVKWKKES